MNEAILLRGIERIAIVMAAVFFGFLGYRLFLKGITDDKANVIFKSKIAQLTFSGAGPGLIFMGFGSLVLIYALVFGGAKSSEELILTQQPQQIEIVARLEKLEKNISQTLNAQDLSIHAKDAENENLRTRIKNSILLYKTTTPSLSQINEIAKSFKEKEEIKPKVEK